MAVKKSLAALPKAIYKHWKPSAAVFLIGFGIGVLFLVSREAPKSKITVSGAWSIYTMMVKWAEEYQKIHPDVIIEVSAGGAGKGMSDALAGLVDIGMVSRDITQEEISGGAFYVEVAINAVVPTININNPVLQDLLTKGIKKQTFYDIFITGNVTTWGQVVSRPEVTDEVHVYTRSDAAGAPETWAKYLSKKQEDLTANPRATGVYGDPGLLTAVQDDPLGIGYNNHNYAYDSSTKLPVAGTRPAPIDIDGNGTIDENENFYENLDTFVHAIQTGAYPSPPARTNYLVTNENRGGWNETTKAFIRWILTDGQRYVPETGFINLPQEKLQQQLTKLG